MILCRQRFGSVEGIPHRRIIKGMNKMEKTKHEPTHIKVRGARAGIDLYDLRREFFALVGGGKIVAAGTLEEICESAESLTGKYLSLDYTFQIKESSV